MQPLSKMVRYPGPGCVVEFLHGNKPQLAWVLEEQSGKLRLVTRSKREMKLPANRVLPWTGPLYPGQATRQDIQQVLDDHAERRDQLEHNVDPMEIWELAQGEMQLASIQWFAELLWDSPEPDHLAGIGRALIECKSHFKFQPPDFEIFTAEKVDERLREIATAKARERLVDTGSRLFQELWAIRQGRQKELQISLEDDLRCQLKELLFMCLADPEDHECKSIWDIVSKGLPDDPHLPLFLAQTWGLIPPNYNYLLDRASYIPGDAWAEPLHGEIKSLKTRTLELAQEPEPLHYLSIDSETTADRDDAFFAESLENNGLRIHLALACPALAWEFGTALDHAVAQRGQSLYLPEATHHMLPEELAAKFFSLNQDGVRPALVLKVDLDEEGEVTDCQPRLAWVQAALNFSYNQAEDLLADQTREWPGNPEHISNLVRAMEAANRIRKRRLAHGAVIIERQDPEISLTDLENGEVKVHLETKPPTPLAQILVSELMILANSALAQWAGRLDLPLIHRTQDIALPKEQSGVYDQPWDIARVVKALGSAILETRPRPHASLGVNAYSPISSPLRRYPDLLNQAQVICWLRQGKPRLSREELESLLPLLNSRLQAVGKVQRFRPRYWKLLYHKQQPEPRLANSVVVEETPIFVTVSLPESQIFVRGPRHLFGDKLFPGQPFQVRLGKIDPLNNDIHILEAREM